MYHRKIKLIAVRIAILFFFIMALVGWICGLPLGTCAVRSVLGAVAVYLVISIAGKLIVRVLISAFIEEQANQYHQSMQG